MISLKVLPKEKQSTRRIYQDSRLSTQNFGVFWHIQNQRHIFITLIYPKLWHIQEIYSESWATRTLRYSHSESCKASTMERFQKQLMAIIIFASYNYFHNIAFTCPLVHEINMIFLMQA